MKQKVKLSKVRHVVEFDATEFLLLAFVAVTLLAFFAWQTGTLPPFLTQAVLGASISR